MRGVRLAVVAVVVAVLGLPAAAQGSFHFMSIREVFTGTATVPDAEYVELQMWAAGQNLVDNHELTEYGSAGFGAESGSKTFDANVMNGQNQATILLASPAAVTELGITPDATLPNGSLDAAGGAVCWATGGPPFDPATPIDCMSYGTFPNTTLAGTPEPVESAGFAFTRMITPNCPTMLEAADDTNDSATDFVSQGGNPRNNAAPITETPCAPDNTVAPRVTGTPAPGRTLSCARGTWTGSPPIAYAYRWLRDGAVISAQTAATYAVKAADASHSIRCRVTASNGGGSAMATSAPVTIKSPPKNTVAPKITGTPRVGRTLSCSLGTWTGSPPITYTRQWLRNGAAIAGATGANYIAKPADRGKSLSCRVIAKNVAGQASRTSAAVKIT